MKKTFTIIILTLAAFAYVNAQVTLFDIDTKGVLSFNSVNSWNTSAGNTKNPTKSGLNTTDSTAYMVTQADNWGQASFTFDSVAMGANNALQFMVCTSSDSFQTVIGDGSLNAGTYTIVSLPTNVVTKKHTWYKFICTLNGNYTPTTKMGELQIRFTSVNKSTNDTIYIDQVQLINYTPTYKQETPRLIFDAPYVDPSSPLTLDGLNDENIYSTFDLADIKENNIDTTNQGPNYMAPPTQNVSGQWAAMWDKTYLYIYFTMSTPTLVIYTDAGFTGWQGSAAQVYIDIKNNHVTKTAALTQFSGLYIYPGGNAPESADFGIGKNWLPMGTDTSLIKQGSYIDGNGGATSGDFGLEIALPWHGLAQGSVNGSIDAFIADSIMSGKEISFDIQMNDNNGATTGNRANMMSWCSRPKEPYGNSGTWGSIKLTGGPVGIQAKSVVNVKMFPNPASSSVELKMDGNFNYTIYDLKGCAIMQNVANNSTLVDLKGIAKGLYIVKFDGSQGTTIQKLQVK
jgi:hypothetical protein